MNKFYGVVMDEDSERGIDSTLNFNDRVSGTDERVLYTDQKMADTSRSQI